MITIPHPEIPDLIVFTQQVFKDERGAFFELFNEKDFNLPHFVQDNISYSRAGTLRGLHYQDPFAQDKLVTCITGSIFDVAVDLRVDSPTFGKWAAVELSATGRSQQYLYIPKGFAHGFLALENSLVHYKCSDYYSKDASKGIIYNDPELKITWPDVGQVIMSKQDKEWPHFDPVNQRIKKNVL